MMQLVGGGPVRDRYSIAEAFFFLIPFSFGQRSMKIGAEQRSEL